MDALKILQAQRQGREAFDALLSETPWLFAGSSLLLAMAIVQAQSAAVLRHSARSTSPIPEQVGLMGSVTTQREAIAVIHAQHPRLLVCTDVLVEGDGLSLVKSAKQICPQIKTVIVLQMLSAMHVDAAWNTGCDALVADPLAGEGNLLNALLTIFAGERWLDSKLGCFLKEKGLDWNPQLTARDLKVMRALVAGLTDREIAAHTGIHYDTVKYTLKRIYAKLGVDNRVGAALAFERMGLDRIRLP